MLTKRQLNSIIINAFAVKMLITFPHNIIEICKNAAWISAIYCTLIAALLFGAVCIVYAPGKNVIELAQKHGGKPLRILTGLAVFAVLFANFFTLLRIFPEAVRLVLLQKTDMGYIQLLLIVCIVLGAYCGMEAIARVQEMFMPIAGVVIIAFIIMLVPTINAENIFPVLGSGTRALFIDNIPFLSVFSDLLLLNLLIPYMASAADYKKTGLKAIAGGGGTIIVIITAYCLSYAYPVSKSFLMPVYQLEQLIHLGTFFSRLEAIFQFVWSISILLYGSLYLIVLADVWKTAFGLNRPKPLLMPIAAITVGMSLLPDSLENILRWETNINHWLYIPVFAIPLIIGITDKLFHVKQ